MTFTELLRQYISRPKAAAPSPQVEEISRDEIVRVIDELARKRRGLSANQLLSAYRAGNLEICREMTDLLAYSELLSPNDPIFFESAPRAARSEARFAVR